MPKLLDAIVDRMSVGITVLTAAGYLGIADFYNLSDLKTECTRVLSRFCISYFSALYKYKNNIIYFV